MSNHKWADVAHYYLKSGIGGKAKLPNTKSFIVPIGINDVGKNPSRLFTPILRALEDMTEGERKELWRYVFSNWRNGNFSENALEFRGRSQFIKSTGSMTSDRWVMSQGVERLGIQSNGEVWADCDLHSFGFKSHLATHWLISKGFDVFGLIDSGQAIRKGVSNV